MLSDHTVSKPFQNNGAAGNTKFTAFPYPTYIAGTMRRSVSDPVLSSTATRTLNSLDGLNINLSISQHALAKPTDENMDCDAQPTDLPLLFQLVAVGFVGAVRGRGKTGRKTGKRGKKLPFVGMSRLQTLMHLGRIKSSSSSSLPNMCRDQMIGLNFADESEANAFNAAISERLAAKQRKKEERKRQSMQLQQGSGGMNQHQHNVSHLQPHHHLHHPPQPPPPQAKPHTVPHIQPYNDSRKKSNNKKGNKNKVKLSKDEIGMPMDFKHITHVGFNPDTGFSQFNMDEKLEGFFNMVGVSEKQLSDSRTREFIYDFIERNGGVEKAIQETQRLSSRATPTPPTSMPPPTPHVKSPVPPTPPQGTRIAPPPPPPRSSIHGHPPPPPPPNIAPPPPPPHTRAHMPPPPGQVVAGTGTKNTPLPPLPPSAGNHGPPPPPPTATIPSLQYSHHHPNKAPAPPPPPPPAPPANGMAPPPPPPPPPTGPIPGTGVDQDARSAMLDQIRNGKNLKKVEPQERPAPDSRSQLMDQIRLGFKLNPVSEDTSNASVKADDSNLEGMAGALQRALAGRFEAIQSDDDSDATSDSDEEWDDDDT